MTDFGDIEEADSYDAESVPDPDQVARRLHELRAYLDDLTGGDRMARFEELTPAERELADSVGDVIVGWLLANEPDNPAALALALHNVRRFWSGNVLPAWGDLDPDERLVAVDFMGHLISWLEREGPL